MGPPRRLRLRLPLASHHLPKAFTLLADPLQLPRIHPLITSVRAHPPSRDEAGLTRVDFDIDEKVPLWSGGPSVTNHYRARITTFPGQELVLRLSGWSSPNIRIETRYSTYEAGLEETVWFSAPWLVRGFAGRMLLTAHRRTLERVCALANG